MICFTHPNVERSSQTRQVMIRLPAKKKKKYRPITQFKYYQIEPTSMNVLRLPPLKSWIDDVTILSNGMCAIFKAMDAARGLPMRFSNPGYVLVNSQHSSIQMARDDV